MCRAYQVPHSVFLGWPKDDRDKAIWQHVRERERCGSCGTRRAEWLESAGGRRDAYEAVLDRCPGCERVDHFRAGLDESKAGKGTFVRLQRRR